MLSEPGLITHVAPTSIDMRGMMMTGSTSDARKGFVSLFFQIVKFQNQKTFSANSQLALMRFDSAELNDCPLLLRMRSELTPFNRLRTLIEGFQGLPTKFSRCP